MTQQGKAHDYDLFVIGAGSGGVRAARLAAVAGARVAIAEADRIGGTCVVRGCIPKKFMVYASEYAKVFKTAAAYGWTIPGEPTFDMNRFLCAVQEEVSRLSGIYRRNLHNSGVELVEERATLAGPHEIRLEQSGRTVTAEKILIAAGGAPNRPDIPGAELAVVSDDVFHLKSVPRHIVVVGGGFIACEFAQVFRGVGAEVDLVYRGDIVLRGFDDDIRTQVTEAMKQQGVHVHTHATLERIARDEATGRLTCAVSDGRAIKTDMVLMAIGRSPAVQGLGLENAGVELDEHGAIRVDGHSRTTAPSVWAVGDVTNRINLTPVAIREGAAFSETEFNGRDTVFDHDNVAAAVFTQPPVGTVGLTEYEARRRFPVDIYRTLFRPMKNVLAEDPQRTLMKLVVRREDEVVVGCHIVGPDAPEIIQAVAIAVKAGLTKQAFDHTCAVHPTAAEELVTLREKYVPNELAG
jgi:glutathione reductase (NADPH)